MTARAVFFLPPSLPITISYKYFTFSRSTIFELTFSFPFKLREELLYFKKSWLSIQEVRVKHCLSLVYSFKKLLMLMLLSCESLGKENLTNQTTSTGGRSS